MANLERRINPRAKKQISSHSSESDVSFEDRLTESGLAVQIRSRGRPRKADKASSSGWGVGEHGSDRGTGPSENDGHLDRVFLDALTIGPRPVTCVLTFRVETPVDMGLHHDIEWRLVLVAAPPPRGRQEQPGAQQDRPWCSNTDDGDRSRADYCTFRRAR